MPPDGLKAVGLKLAFQPRWLMTRRARRRLQTLVGGHDGFALAVLAPREIVLRIHAGSRKGPHAVNLNDRFAIGPREVMDTDRHAVEAAGTNGVCGRRLVIERVSCSDMDRT